MFPVLFLPQVNLSPRCDEGGTADVRCQPTPQPRPSHEAARQAETPELSRALPAGACRLCQGPRERPGRRPTPLHQAGPLGGHSDAGGWPPTGANPRGWPVQVLCVPLALPRCPGHLPLHSVGGRVPGRAQLHKGQRDHFVSPNSPRGHSQMSHRRTPRGLTAKHRPRRVSEPTGRVGIVGCGKEGTGRNGLGSAPSGFQVILFKPKFTPGFYLHTASGPQVAPHGSPWPSRSRPEVQQRLKA